MNLSRRTFLSVAATSSLLSQALANGTQNGGKSVIWIWLGGGISATEFINPIPNAPSEYRSITGHVQTNAGYLLGGNFEYMAKIGDKMSPILSFHHKDASHGSATGWVMNSRQLISGEGIPQTDPSYGSIVSYLTEPVSPRGIPSYVKINPIQYDGSSFLGAKHIGYEASGEGIKNLTPNVELNRFNSRVDMVRNIDKKDDNLFRSWSVIRNQASDIVGGTANKAFDIKLEDPKTLDKYRVDKSQLGANLLLARRLIQNGSKFITLHHGGWDMHADIHKGFNNLAPDVDYSIYTLVQELEALDMLQNTMVIISSEFSRTPKLNKGLVNVSDVPGRDHWPSVVPLVLIGGEYDRGNVIGTTNHLAEYPTSNPFTPKDLIYTIFDHFGLDLNTTVYDNMNRPRHLIEDGARLIG